MLLCKGVQYALPAHEIHKQCFENGWSEKEFLSLLNLPTSRLWMNEKGMLLCSHVADEMEILTFGIIPKYRRQGLGKQLLNQMFEYAKENKINEIFLDVAEDNIPAIKLYEKMGFEFTYRRKGYYQNGKTDALIYTKQI